MRKDILLGVFLTIAWCSGAQSQQQNEPLRNGDIVEFVKSGAPVDTIVRAILSRPAQFDTSPLAVCALRNAGVSQAVLDAMRIAGKDSQTEILRTLPAVNLSENFVMAAREALKAIQHCTGTMFLDQSGVVLPPETQRFIDNANAVAASEGEEAVVEILKNLFVAKLNTNMTRAVIMQGAYSPESKERMKAQIDADEIIKASESKQRRCGAALNLALNCRTFAERPRDCLNVAQ
jgi:hypothetical protein